MSACIQLKVRDCAELFSSDFSMVPTTQRTACNINAPSFVSTQTHTASPNRRKAPQFLIISIGSNVIFPTLEITALYLRKSVWPSKLCVVQAAQTPVQRIRCQSAPSNVP